MSHDSTITITVDSEDVEIEVADPPNILVLGTSKFPGPQGPEGQQGPPGESALNLAIRDVSSAELLDLQNTPIELVPAQGPGTVIFVRYIVNNYAYNTRTYLGDTPYIRHDLIDPDEGGRPLPGLVSLQSSFLDSNDEIPLDGPPEKYDNKSVWLCFPDNATRYLNTIGDITSHALVSGGSDYLVGDTGYVTGLEGGSANYEVLSVDGSGAVLTYSMTTPEGDDLPASTVGEVLTTEPLDGIGSGFTLEVLSILPGDGDTRVFIEWQLLFLAG